MTARWTLPFCLCLLAAPLFAAEPMDYARDVKPILARHCYACHGPDKQRSGLRLDSAAAMRKGGNAGPAIVPGQGSSSRLLQAVTGGGEVKPMPPKGPRLSAAEVARLCAWIDQGAKAPAEEKIAAAAAASKHWAFRPPVRPPEPAVRNARWVRNPIDRFILARLEREGIAPSPEADRLTLIRRLSLDLLGLPPSVAEVDAFVHDPDPDAYAKVVDRLLASPHYGERWGRHWLDVARYADSNGFNIDAPRSIWPYRDWVINALNRDMPFDRFTVEQIAGDLLPHPTTEQVVATGFHRNTLRNEEGGIDVEQFRVESVKDRVSTTGTAWLGLTIGCAQCHDHKYDPITQREFYQFYAFFNNADEPSLELPTPEQLRQRREFQARLADLERQQRALDPTTEASQANWEHKLRPEDKHRLPAAIQAILAIPDNGRDARQQRTLNDAYRQADELRHAVGGLGSPLPLLAVAHVEAGRERARLRRDIAALWQHEPVITTTLVMSERATPRPAYVQLGGDFLRKGAAVAPDVPAALRVPLPAAKSRPNRLDLARWLVDPRNPLPARVTVNRLWQHHFGTGLVETENDFGTQGRPPSHPQLLDYLATEFVARGWSLKAMHRLIVTSATYRQASTARPELAVRDPANRLLARQNRLRLEAEVVRDVALSASGLLSDKIGGPTVYPPQPEGVYRFTQVPRDWKANVGPDRYRRGLYIHFWRSAPYPALLVFDAPDSTTTCTRRNRSNTPLQALTLLNDEAFFEFAQGLAARILHEGPPDDAGRLRYAFRICLTRPPAAREESRLARLLAEVRAGADNDRDAWATVARVLLNLDEFITRE
jgi:mono/diheme cytochrome c family protein